MAASYAKTAPTRGADEQRAAEATGRERVDDDRSSSPRSGVDEEER